MSSPTDTGSFDIIDATIDDVHTAFRAGEITAAALVDRYLARIDEYDELNAILTVNEDARRRAERLDSQFEADGFVGPLHGVPIVLKDNQDTHDMPTTAGSKVLAESVPPRDAFLVERLRDAGGIVLAKANLQELSFGVDTISSLGGETRNAYAVDRRPSGSSGGTAVAIAANLGLIGTGTDTCSSVRSPPAFANLVGVRPTRGLVSRTGIVPLSETQDTAGPITRTVADAARMLDVVAGYDPADPVTALGAGTVPEDGYASRPDDDGLEDARIGVVRSLFGVQDEDSAPEAAADAVTAVLDEAIAELASAGATIVDPVAVMERESVAAARVTEYEFERDFDRYLADLGEEAPCDSLRDLLDTGTVAPAVETRIRESGALDVDVETLHENVEYLRRLARRRAVREDTVARLEAQDLDALLYPPSTIPPVERPAHQPFDELNCELAAHSGLPSIVVPAGFTDDGLPVGLELLGRPFAEPRLLELAYAYERVTEHRRPPDGFGEIA